MTALFAGGHVFDAILVITLLEGLVLVAWHRRTGRGLAPLDALGNLAAGFFLLVAARTALAGTWWGFTAAALLAAGLSHLFDLRRRLALTIPAPRGALTLPSLRDGPLPLPPCGRGARLGIRRKSPSPASREREGPGPSGRGG